MVGQLLSVEDQYTKNIERKEKFMIALNEIMHYGGAMIGTLWFRELLLRIIARLVVCCSTNGINPLTLFMECFM